MNSKISNAIFNDGRNMNPLFPPVGFLAWQILRITWSQIET
jgi:hypothetical protein